MQDIVDTFNQTSILENAKNWHKMAYIKTISAQLLFPHALRICQKLTKIAEYSYKVLQVLLIFLNLETLNMLNNKHPRKDDNVARLLFKCILSV